MQNMRAVALETDIDRIAQSLKIRHPRFRLMWLVGIETGLRISDLLSLTPGMFAPAGAFTLTERKTGKERRCFLSQELWLEVKQFMNIHRLAPDDFVFFSSSSDKKKPISRQWATRMIAQDAKLRGLSRIGAHSMRKVYACKLYLSSGQISSVQAALNHRYPSTTMHYLADLLPGIGQEANLKPLPEPPRAHRRPAGVFSRLFNRLFKALKA